MQTYKIEGFDKSKQAWSWLVVGCPSNEVSQSISYLIQENEEHNRWEKIQITPEKE